MPAMPEGGETPVAGDWRDEPFRRLVETVSDYAILLLDTEGRITTWNRGAERINGYKPAEVVGRHFSLLYTPAATSKGWPQHELETAKRFGRFEDEGWRVRKDGTNYWANVIITAIRDDRGRLLGFSKIAGDLTERRENEERLRQSEERFRLLLEGVEDAAIVMLDPDGRVVSWNTGAQRITGYAAGEIVGRSFECFFPQEDIAAGAPTAELRAALLNRRVEDRGWRVRKDGGRYWAQYNLTALHDRNGALYGFAKVMRDLSEHKRMEVLEAQGRHLTEFLAMLAHELRNPLAPIRNALAIMSAAPGSLSQLAWCREVIERQTVHLTRLVDDLLDVSRITRGKLRMQGATMDLNAAAQRAIEASKPLIDLRRHRLRVDLRCESLAVNGDLTRLAQVIMNLLNNAAKYTPEGGDITLEVEAERNEAVVRVRDTGAGIAPQLLDKVFDLFAQGERTLDRAEGGLGVGLTLARRIVELHGGSITASSAGVGKGAEFVVRLPRLNLESGSWASRTGSFELPIASQKRTLVVVDDNVDSANSMAMLLRMAGHEVSVEYDGASAIARIAEVRPDIVLLDIGLPGMNGYEIAKQLRARPEGQGLRIYALTGYGQAEDRNRSVESGFDGHLVKPVQPAELLALIDSPKHSA